MREVRYWHSRLFWQTYGRDRSWKGFPRQDASGCYLTMGYRILLDDGQPEDGEPSREPSAPMRTAQVRTAPSAPAPAEPRAENQAGAGSIPRPIDPARERSDRRAPYRRFGHSGGFDGYEGRMATSEPARPAKAPLGDRRPKGGQR
ncbi:hypothetical protein [Methylobacterium oxalidis]|uniref:Uncharacterized protein n=1 Tax=Methylobacterium oxalidis TaxID=944322 RepID=A0A512IXV1_9HYPH|nr:hypothetical protein [Methylobacterium oxalidis]GEP02516.1 hypothetical protein MOX02_05540 [Methylobacterium oxalidis]GJE32030.1 hypothetical protein LDDCCGHA_2212 [Methylobacterium oxalidis]GLS67895.1 hypothetical protein GCM10007888_62800 [Methylobacterium oxalidis]